MTRYLKYLDRIVFPIAGFYLIYLYTKYSGVGLSPDSIMYTSAARSLHTNGTLITFNNTPITDFPVFYPVFLWLELAITHVDPIAAGPILNGLLFALLLYLSSVIIGRFKPNSWLYKWVMLTAIVLSPALLQVYTYLWSETLFIVIILLFIIAAWQYLVKHTLTALLVFAFIAALSSITRYAGVTVIATGGLLLLMDRSLTLTKKFQHIIIYSIAACALFIINLLKNVSVTGHLTGRREESLTPFIKNVHYFGKVLCDWAGFSERSYPFATTITIILFITLTGVLICNYLKKQITRYENIAVAFTFVYGAFIIISSTLSRYEQINTRLLSPLFITLLLSCTYWGINAVKISGPKFRYYTTGILVLFMLGFIYMEAFKTTMNTPDSVEGDFQRYDDESDYGVPGYSDDSWNKSAFTYYLKTSHSLFKPGIPIYSDANDAVYLFSGVKVKLLPHWYFKTDVQKFYRLKHYYLVWFPAMDTPELVSLKDIVKVEKLKILRQFPDGGIYEYDGE